MSIQRIALRGLSTDQLLQRLAESINALIDGKQDVTGNVTLTAGATSTVVEDNKFESAMVPVFTPTTAHAATALAGLYVSARTKGGFTLTHANTADADKTLLYVRFG